MLAKLKYTFLLCFFFTENPVICKDYFSQLVDIMNAQEALILGIAHCIVPKEEIPVGPPAVMSPLIEHMLKIQKLPAPPSAIIYQSPSIVQVIIPVEATELITTTESIIPPTRVETTQVQFTTTELPVSSTTVNLVTTQSNILIGIEPTTILPPSSTTEPILKSSSTEQSTIKISSTEINDTLLIVSPLPTLNTPPPLLSLPTEQQQHTDVTTIAAAAAVAAATNASIDETFSPIQTMELVSTEKTQPFTEPEEPPEQSHVDSVTPNN